MRARRWLGLWFPVIAVMAALFALSAQRQLPGEGIVWDKAAHAGVYAVLGGLCLRATHGGLRRPGGGALWAGAGLALAYAMFDEVHQAWVPGRDASPGDWLADAAGVALSVPLLAALARLQRLQREAADGSRSETRRDDRPGSERAR